MNAASSFAQETGRNVLISATRGDGGVGLVIGVDAIAAFFAAVMNSVRKSI